MNQYLIITVSLAYLALLFGIAWWVERRRSQQKSVVNNGWVYALSLAVYCTGWTYYGSVGRAVTNGIDFITIYLGPSIMCALFIPILQKIIRICKTQRINSIADFIATRYGKNFTLGVIVTLCCIIGIIPYIALQLKAISSSFHTITGLQSSTGIGFSDDNFYITLVIIFFIIVFGTRSVDATERHEGLVAAVAFESLIKLFAFLVVGIFVTYFVFDGFGPIFQAIEHRSLDHFFTMPDKHAYSNWISMLLVSMMAMILLPRQFQVSVVENTNERHIKKAIWLFPLYLLAINIFVLPIAMGGSLLLGDAGDADMYVLSLPLHFNQNALSVLVYIGGFSAATSMIIVETIALSIMVSNHLVLPLMFSVNKFAPQADGSFTRRIIFSRRLIIAFILLAAYGYNAFMAPYFSLVSIGLASMAAVAQFAPAVFGGLYWRNASRKGAVTGIVIGFIIWFYTLIIPSGVDAGFIDKHIMEYGPWGFSFLKPQALFGLQEFDLLTHSIFWSLLFNSICYFTISVYSKLSASEIYQAKVFVDIFEKDIHTWAEGQGVLRGNTQYGEVKTLVENFLGKSRTAFLFESYAKRNNIALHTEMADPRIVNFSERILSGIVGSASAQFLVSNIVKDEEEISIKEVLAIIKESQQALELNKELKKKSIELSRATDMLTAANEQLKRIDVMKDEFLYTVTHELRTPLTSIRALSEIVYDNPDMDEEQRQFYLEGIIKEIERLSHLITQVLNLERYESGRQKLNLSTCSIGDNIRNVAAALKPLADEKSIKIHQQVQAMDFIVMADKDLINQVLYNLVANAIKFAPEQGNIHLALEQKANYIEVSVADDGPGIPAEMRALIFDKFFQAKNQTLKKPTGTGLGLTISKRIVELHQGEIWVDDATISGARFIFSLPLSV